MFKTFFYVISVTKCPHVVPSHNYFITLWASMVDMNCLNLLSRPIMYKTSFFIIKGSTLLANHCFWLVVKDYSICPICKNIFTSFNHFGYVKNKLMFMVCFGTLEKFVVLGGQNICNYMSLVWFIYYYEVIF
jgi:hypothetical protein